MKKYTRTHIVISILIAAVLIVSCNSPSTTNNLKSESIIPVKLMELQEVNSGNTIHASGVFTTEDETLLSFKNGGIVQRIFVNEGDNVSKGQLLATLNLAEINTGVQQASLALEKAERDYNRALQLFRDSVATREQLENAKTARDIALQQNTAAQFNKSFSEIRALNSGYVLKKFVNDGQTVGPGTPILQVNGATNSGWKLKVGVSDKQWSAINVGDNATIETDLLKEKIKARVLRKSEAIDPASGTFTVTLKVDERTSGLASGAFARARINSTNTATGWNIPYDALLNGDGGEGCVFVTNNKDTAKRVKVNLGEITKDSIQVLEGLEDYKYLIISGSAYLKEGSTIKPFE